MGQTLSSFQALGNFRTHNDQHCWSGLSDKLHISVVSLSQPEDLPSANDWIWFKHFHWFYVQWECNKKAKDISSQTGLKIVEKRRIIGLTLCYLLLKHGEKLATGILSRFKSDLDCCVRVRALKKKLSLCCKVMLTEQRSVQIRRSVMHIIWHCSSCYLYICGPSPIHCVHCGPL